MPTLPQVELRSQESLEHVRDRALPLLLRTTYPLNLPSKSSDHQMRSSLTLKIDVASRLDQVLLLLELMLTEQAFQ